MDAGQAGPSGIKTFKVWCKDRTVRKAVTCFGFNQLVEKTKAKFSIPDDIVISLVMEEDGTELDEDYFNFINNKTLMVLKGNEAWTPELMQGKAKQHETEDEQKNSILEFVEKMQAKLNKKAKGKGIGKQEKPVRVNIGWLNYSFKEKRYIQVKNTAKNPGNGSTSVIIYQSSDFEETKRVLEEEFFPNGKNSKGKLSGMETSLGYFTGKEIAKEQFQSVGDWINEEKVLHQRARLYLLTKKKLMRNYELMETQSTDSDDSDCLPSLSFARPKKVKTSDDDSVLKYTYCHTGAGPSTLHPNINCSAGLPHVQSPQVTNTLTPSSYSTSVTTAAVAICTPIIDNSSGSHHHHHQNAQNQQWLPAGTPTVLFQQGHAAKKCTICFDREISNFFLPCGHTTCLV